MTNNNTLNKSKEMIDELLADAIEMRARKSYWIFALLFHDPPFTVPTMAFEDIADGVSVSR